MHEPNCGHQAFGWCWTCVEKLEIEISTLREENKKLKARIVAMQDSEARQSQSRRLDYEDGLPWWEDDR